MSVTQKNEGKYTTQCRGIVPHVGIIMEYLSFEYFRNGYYSVERGSQNGKPINDEMAVFAI